MKNILYIPSRFYYLLPAVVVIFLSCQKQPTPPPQNSIPELITNPAVLPFQGVDKRQIETILAGLTLEEKIGQMVIWTPDLSVAANQQAAISFIKKGKVGGVMPRPLPVRDYLIWIDSLQRNSAIPLLVGTREKVALHNQFTNTAHFPNPTSIAALDSTGLQSFLAQEYLAQCRSLGVQFAFLPELSHLPDTATPAGSPLQEQQAIVLERLQQQIADLTSQRIIAFADGFATDLIELNDSLRFINLAALYKLTSNGLPGLFIPDGVFESESIRSSQRDFLQNYLQRKMGFQGLLVAHLLESESPELKLLQGSELFVTPDVPAFFQYTRQLIAAGIWSEQDLDERVRKILTAKAWVNGGRLPVELSVMPRDSARQAVRLVSFTSKQTPKPIRPYLAQAADFEEKADKITSYFEHRSWTPFARGLFEKSVTLASDRNKLIPFKDLLRKQFSIVSGQGSYFREFINYFEKYADYRPINIPINLEGHFSSIAVESTAPSEVFVVLLDTFAISPVKDAAFISSINQLSLKNEVVIVNFGNPQQLGFFAKNITFFQVYERNKWTEQQAAQGLFGGVAVNGKLPVAVSEDLPVGASEYIYQERVSFNDPEEAGIATERLVGIDAIANTAIQKRVFPGCQVAVIKDGTVVYSKGFGHHTYAKDQPVKTTDLYDIASVSKIAATTLAVMKLHEQNQISLTGKIGQYIDLQTNPTVGSIKVKDLLIHNSGLQAPMPISRFYNYRSVPASGCNDIFCKSAKGDFKVQIAPSLFFRHDYQDTIWQRVSQLRKLSTRKGFRYSDVNFYLLQKAVEDLSRSSLDEYVSSHFYRSIGLRRLLFNPMQHYDRSQIVPTERDQMWRKSLVHGFVHDPSAALMGGIGGNAGIFANAEDLAVLFQILANDGIYGGIQYFEPKTIQTFTTAKYGNHRGLGFDKPSRRSYPTFSHHAPASTFGHNGFTGTCVWVDPENRLVYVFLSNRIHPSSQNKKIFTEDVRRRIHEVVYDALESFDPELPRLAD